MISKEIKFLLTHSSIYGLGTVIARLVSFLLLPLYTRYLTPSDYGVLETIDVSTAIIGIVVTIGIARSLSRFYYVSKSQDDRDRVLITTYLTYMSLAILSAPFLFLTITPISNLLFSNEQFGYYFKISFLSLLLGGLIDIGLMYLRLIKKPHIFISISLTRLVFLIALNVFFIVYLKMGIVGILYSTLIVRFLFAVVMTSAIWYRIKFGFSFATCREILRFSLPTVPSSLGSTVVKQSDKYFVLYFMSLSDMGIYSLSLKFGNTIHQLLTSPFNLAYIPRRFEIMNQPDAAQIYRKVFSYYLYFLIFVGLSISILIPEIMSFMVTPEFMKAADIIPLVVLSMIIFGTHYHLDFGILYSKKTEYLAYTNIVCAFLQVTLNILLIPPYGIHGAVWSSIASLSIQAIILYWLSHRFFVIRYEFRRIFAYSVLAIAFYGLSLTIHSDHLLISVMLKLMLLIAFFPSALAIRILSPEDTKAIYGFVSSKISTIFKKRGAITTP